MRYQNWDVLLFPGHSRIPIQEFNSACHILLDQGQLALSKWAPPEDPFVTKYESMTKTPILTCFVPSLSAGTPFRISIHSWEKPSASTILKSRKAHDEPIAFEARVYVDGSLQSTRVFREGNVWPEVIELKGQNFEVPLLPTNSLDGRSQDPVTELAFPAFHAEILQQPRWDPGEQLGRIQIVLTEGVLREAAQLQTSARKVAFDGLRDIIAFSFQHAPQGSVSHHITTIVANEIDVLEYSGIAWPNARLFESRIANTRRQPPLSTRLSSLTGPEAHAHSPQRPPGSREDTWTRIANKADQSYRGFAHHCDQAAETRFSKAQAGQTRVLNALSGSNDPFIAPGPESSLGWRSARKTSTDESMPDYMSYGTDNSRAETDMSITWPRRDFQKHMDEAAVEEIIEALSPTRKAQLLNALSPGITSFSGVQAPANTPDNQVNKQDSYDEETPKEGLSNAASGNSGSAKTIGAGTLFYGANPRNVMTRSMKASSSCTTNELETLRPRRGRSSSGSSKRKRSQSPETEDISREFKLDPVAPTMVQKTKPTPVRFDETSSEDGSAPSVYEEGKVTNVGGKGVSLDV